MRHLGRGIKRPIAPVWETEGRETRASLSIFKGTIKRAGPLPSRWNTVQAESCCFLWLDFHPPLHLPLRHIHSYLPISLSVLLSILLDMGGGVPLCPLGPLVWLRRRGFCGHGIWQGQSTYKKQCRIHSPAQSKQRETLLLDLTERSTWMQTDPALQSEPPEWGVLFDLIPAMCPEPHAHTDFTGITRGRCLHWGYSTTQRGNPLRMPKVWIFPW